MTYFVNKTDGNAIVVLDGTKDTTSTSLTLIGRLAQTYGESQNENFLKLLENFAFTSPPSNPINGQLWFDTAANSLKVRINNNAWSEVGALTVGDATVFGNSSIGGSISISPFPFLIYRNGVNLVFENTAQNSNYLIKSNVAGTTTTVASFSGTTGEFSVIGNATSNFGVTTKIYVDSATANLTASLSSLSSTVTGLNSSVIAIQSGVGSVSGIDINAQTISLNGNTALYNSGTGNTVVNFQTPEAFTFLSAYGTAAANLITVSGQWVLGPGATLNSSYADLAEYYSADKEYEPGTVVIFGGDADVTITNKINDTRVAGVVSQNPAYIMNESVAGTRVCLALQGRVHCKVLGPVRKGDLLTTAENAGYAKKADPIVPGSIIGKSLTDNNTNGPCVIEIAVGRA